MATPPGQRDGVGTRGETQLPRGVVRGTPDRRGHVDFGRHRRPVLEASQDALREGRMGNLLGIGQPVR